MWLVGIGNSKGPLFLFFAGKTLAISKIVRNNMYKLKLIPIAHVFLYVGWEKGVGGNDL